MIKCKKCHFFKIDDKSKCACNVKKFDADKLVKGSKKTRKPIKQISDKKRQQKREEVKNGLTLLGMYARIAKKRTDKIGNFVCGFCGERGNMVDYPEYIQPTMFFHILAKGIYPLLKFFKNNICFGHPECHTEMDTALAQSKNHIRIERAITNGEDIDCTDFSKYD